MSFDPDVTEFIGARLDEYGLFRYHQQLVIVGGAAMSAYGLQTLAGKDIDIAVTQRVMGALMEDGYVTPSDDLITDVREIYGETLAIGNAKLNTPTRPQSPEIENNVVHAHVMPLQVSYLASSEEMIYEGVVPEDSAKGYRYSPLARILDIKLNLASSNEISAEEAKKHLQDAKLISKYLLVQETARNQARATEVNNTFFRRRKGASKNK